MFLPGIPEGQRIASDLGVEYCAVRIEFGAQGAQRALPVGPLSDLEKELVNVAVADLRKNVSTGLAFVQNMANGTS